MSLQSRIRSAKRLMPLVGGTDPGGPAGNPVQRDRPGSGPARRRHRRWSTTTGTSSNARRRASSWRGPSSTGEIETLFYAIRDADTGEWISTMYRVIGGVKRLSDGWEHSWEYPAFEQHPDLDPERPYLLVMLAVNPSAGESAVFYAVIPVHQPGGLWDRVLGALEPVALGEGIRPMGDRGSPRNAVRRRRAGEPRRRRPSAGEDRQP